MACSNYLLQSTFAGILLIELLKGRPPFTASNPHELLMKIEGNEWVMGDAASRLAAPVSIFARNNDCGGLLPPSIASTLSASGKDLITGLLRYDPKHRIGFQEFFDHPWISGVPASAPTAAIQAPPSPSPSLQPNLRGTAAGQCGGHNGQPTQQHASVFLQQSASGTHARLGGVTAVTGRSSTSVSASPSAPPAVAAATAAAAAAGHAVLAAVSGAVHGLTERIQSTAAAALHTPKPSAGEVTDVMRRGRPSAGQAIATSSSAGARRPSRSAASAGDLDRDVVLLRSTTATYEGADRYGNKGTKGGSEGTGAGASRGITMTGTGSGSGASLRHQVQVPVHPVRARGEAGINGTGLGAASGDHSPVDTPFNAVAEDCHSGMASERGGYRLSLSQPVVRQVPAALRLPDERRAGFADGQTSLGIFGFPPAAATAAAQISSAGQVAQFGAGKASATPVLAPIEVRAQPQDRRPVPVSQQPGDADESLEAHDDKVQNLEQDAEDLEYIVVDEKALIDLRMRAHDQNSNLSGDVRRGHVVTAARHSTTPGTQAASSGWQSALPSVPHWKLDIAELCIPWGLEAALELREGSRPSWRDRS